MRFKSESQTPRLILLKFFQRSRGERGTQSPRNSIPTQLNPLLPSICGACSVCGNDWRRLMSDTLNLFLKNLEMHQLPSICGACSPRVCRVCSHPIACYACFFRGSYATSYATAYGIQMQSWSRSSPFRNTFFKYQHSAEAELSRCASDSKNSVTLGLNISFLDDALEDQRRYVSAVN